MSDLQPSRAAPAGLEGEATRAGNEPPSGKKRKSGGKSLWADARSDLMRSPIFIAALLILLVVLSWAVVPGAVDRRTDATSASSTRRTCRRPGGPSPCRPASPRATSSAVTSSAPPRSGCDMYSEIIYGARPSIIVAVMVTLLHDAHRHHAGHPVGLLRRLDRHDHLPHHRHLPRPAVPARRAGVPRAAELAGHLAADARAGRPGLDVDEPDRARQRAVAARPGLRRRRPRDGGQQPPDHPAPHPAQLAGAGHRARHALRRLLRRRRGDADLPRRRAPAAARSRGASRSRRGRTSPTAGFSHLLVFPCIALILTVLSFILMGDKLRDALDPKGR